MLSGVVLLLCASLSCLASWGISGHVFHSGFALTLSGDYFSLAQPLRSLVFLGVGAGCGGGGAQGVRGAVAVVGIIFGKISVSF